MHCNLTTHFIDRSSSEYQSAMRTLADDGFEHDGVQFYLRAGFGLEFVLKATLCSISPSLIADPLKFDQLLALSTADGVAVLSKSGLRTCSLAEAIERAAKAVPELHRFRGILTEVANRRNAVVHLGHCDLADQEQHAASVLRAAEVCLDRLGEDFADFMGAFHAAAAATMDDSQERAAASVAARIARARQTFEETYDGGLSFNMVSALHEDAWHHFGEAIPYDCPACQTKAILRGLSEIVEHADVEREGRVSMSFEFLFYPEGFECRACGLNVRGHELAYADIEDCVEPEYSEQEMLDLMRWEYAVKE